MTFLEPEIIKSILALVRHRIAWYLKGQRARKELNLSYLTRLTCHWWSREQFISFLSYDERWGHRWDLDSDEDITLSQERKIVRNENVGIMVRTKGVDRKHEQRGLSCNNKRSCLPIPEMGMNVQVFLSFKCLFSPKIGHFLSEEQRYTSSLSTFWTTIAFWKPLWLFSFRKWNSHYLLHSLPQL